MAAARNQEPVTMEDIRNILEAHSIAVTAAARAPAPKEEGSHPIMERLNQMTGLLITIGLAACAWAFTNLDDRVQDNSDAITKIAPILERLTVLQEGDQTALTATQSWRAVVGEFKESTNSRLTLTESRLDRLEEHH